MLYCIDAPQRIVTKSLYRTAPPFSILNGGKYTCCAVLKDASFGKEVEGEVGAGPPRNTNGVNFRGPAGKPYRPRDKQLKTKTK